MPFMGVEVTTTDGARPRPNGIESVQTVAEVVF